MGIAISDDRGMMAFPYGVLEVAGLARDDVVKKIGDICAKEGIEKIIVGVPRGLSRMQDTEMTDRATSFADSLRGLHVPIEFEDEFLSTKQAERGPTSKEHIDASAAALTLQTYLDRKRGMVK